MPRYPNGPYIHRWSSTKVWIESDVAEFESGETFDFKDNIFTFISMKPATFTRDDFEAAKRDFQEKAAAAQREREAENTKRCNTINSIRSKLTTDELELFDSLLGDWGEV